MSLMRRLKKQIAGLPVVGPAVRGVYHRSQVGLMGQLQTGAGRMMRRVSGAAPVGQVGGPVQGLRGTALFDGAAVLSCPQAADTLAQAITQAAGTLPVIIFPSPVGNEIRIGLMETDRAAFAMALSKQLGASVRWGAGDVPDVSVIMLNWGDVLPVTLRATLYSPEGGAAISGDTRNDVMRHIHGATLDRLRQPGCHMAADLMGARPAPQDPAPVDVVYTWVNHDDPDWQRLHAAATGRGDVATAAADGESLSRFVSRDELRYSIRSVERYMPWVNRIYVLTNCAPPAWFAPSDRVVWVHHKEVMDPAVLPCFNSHAIEAHLHLIPELSENFLYFNDDFFVSQPVPRSFFFAANGQSNANLEDYGVVNGTVSRDDKDYLNAARNGVALLQDTFGVSPARLHKHTPYALRKSVLQEIETRFPDAMRQTRAARFRSLTDVSFVSFFYHHYAFWTGCGTQSGYRGKIIKHTTPNLRMELAQLQRERGAWVFCLNDGDDSHLNAKWNEMIPAFLAARYPVATAAEQKLTDLPR